MPTRPPRWEETHSLILRLGYFDAWRHKYVKWCTTSTSIFDSQGMRMNYARIALASLGAMVAYFVYGFVMFAALPAMKTEFMKYPNVYRPKDDMMKMMPYGMIAILIAIVAVAILYAKIYPAGGGIVSGVTLGGLSG